MKKSIILLAVLTLASCGGGTPTPLEPQTPEAQREPATPAVVENWTYNQTEDKMSGTTAYYATCLSPTRVEFKFPYDQKGGSSFDITCRKNGDGTDLYVTVSKGYFLISVMDENNITRVRFDDGKPMNIQFTGPTDHSNQTIFLHSTKKLIEKMKKAKKMYIEATFYHEGTKVLEFDVAGFKWDHK